MTKAQLDEVKAQREAAVQEIRATGTAAPLQSPTNRSRRALGQQVGQPYH